MSLLSMLKIFSASKVGLVKVPELKRSVFLLYTDSHVLVVVNVRLLRIVLYDTYR